MSSRFFAANSDSSESESDEQELYSNSEDESSSEEGSEEGEGEDASGDGDSDASGDANFFLKGGDSDDSDDDSDSGSEKATVVRSAKDKRFEEAEAVIKMIDNAVKIGDWAVTSSEFDKLTRLVPNLSKILDGKVPKLYTKTLADLETASNEAYEKQKAAPKKANAVQQRGLNAVRQKVRKLVKEEPYQTDVDKYRADPDDFMKEETVTVVEKTKTKAKRIEFEAINNTAGDDDDGFETVGRDGKALSYTTESVLKNLRQISESRGRKGTDRAEQIRILEKLLDVATVDYQRIRVLISLISARFDTTSTTGVALDIAHWKAAQQELQKLFEILEAATNIVVVEGAEEWEDDEKLPTIPEEGLFKIPGSASSFAERLDDELTRSLQNIDPHTPEYIDRLRDEAQLYTSIVRAQLYQEELINKAKIETEKVILNRIISRRIEHLYFKPTQVVNILEENTWKEMPSSLDSTITPREGPKEPDLLMKILCNHIFNDGDATQRARAMLCQIYWLALHDKYYEARDYALMSHLSESINAFDTPTQVLFNRALVQIGMAAFRKGLISDSQYTLQEICGSNRQKELLAQGVQLQRYSQISPDQERLEKQRLYPFHMHINLELLETIYLTSSMLLEIPLLAQVGSSPESKKRVISKQFRRLLEYHERAIFAGPPENTRDHVLQAAKALAAGDWKKSATFIEAIKIWELLPQATEIKTMLTDQIQVEGLRTYLFTYAPYYDTLSMDTLCSMFELSQRKVAAVVSKMIAHEELSAALDQVSSSIIFRKGVGLSRLQTLALALSDKASGLIESNEKVLEQRTQGTANAFERNPGGRGGRGGGRGGRGRGGARGGQGGGEGGRPRGGQGFTGGALGRAIQA
ncbi:eukaryotic translation initiation factor 3 subunit 8 [Microthyrium microscopicum]|uniref:Eukaryotic translation initiation factor 3 subunit C n=1 Tax=Microthyrium microscopicum TaxID=703497 RepID=A0A6A6U2G5_9PEZI|nr:eukaryotic translation initiation factor 3 subunit 8 [Microthyrium microscopicum]